MNTQRNIALNALTLLVRKNDPTLFDNPVIFEKNLVSNGCNPSSEEVSVLKQSLSYRLPWKVRKNGVTIDSNSANLISSEFAEKTNVPLESAIWATRAWITAMGIKLVTLETAKATESASVKTVNNAENAVKANAIPRPEAFTNPTGRLGIVFGEDSSGSVKVFNAWYGDAPKSETSGMAATPIKRIVEPVVPFKAALKKSEKAEEKVKPAKKEAIAEVDNSIPEKVIGKAEQQISSNNSADFDTETEYNANPIEKTAMSMLQQGERFAYDVIKMLAPVAKAGSAFSCRLIGELYYRGYGIKQDFNAARAWLQIAANKGDAESQYLMGNIYQFGMGVSQDISIAMQYFQNAANQGHRKALESINQINGLVGVNG